MTAAIERFGPWAEGIDPAERLARLQSLRAIVRLTTGPRGEALADELHRAERDAGRQVKAEILRVMTEARAGGTDDIRAAQRTLPSVPTMLLYELQAELDMAEVDAWWERVERTIDGEVIRNAIAATAA